MSEDKNWRCKNCGNLNVRTDTCPNCGKKDYVPNQTPPSEAVVPKNSKSEELFNMGMNSFVDANIEPDKEERIVHLSRAHGYLTMAYKAAGDDIEEKKGIAGFMSLILAYMDDYKNAETWARTELSINPTNVFAKLAWFYIELDKLVRHKEYPPQADWSLTGIILSLFTTGVDNFQVASKKTAVRTAAIEAATAIYNKARTDSEPNIGAWILWSLILLSIIKNMWAIDMKEPYLCKVLLNLPWNRFTKEQIKDSQEYIQDIQVQAHGFLGRLI